MFRIARLLAGAAFGAALFMSGYSYQHDVIIAGAYGAAAVSTGALLLTLSELEHRISDVNQAVLNLAGVVRQPAPTDEIPNLNEVIQ